MFINSDIDLRDEFESFKEDFADDILYARASRFIRCTCFNALHQVGDPDCPKCGGTGRFTTMQKYNVVSNVHNGGAKGNMLKTTEVGLAYAPLYTFYFSFNNMPKIRDRIYIMEYDKLGRPINVLSVCEITGIDPVNGNKGRDELYTTYARVRPELTRDAQKLIYNLSDSDKDLLTKGKQILWPLVK